MGNFPGYLLGLRHRRLPSPLLTTLSFEQHNLPLLHLLLRLLLRERTIDCYMDEVRSIFSKVTNLYHSDLALWYLFEDCRFIPMQLLLVCVLHSKPRMVLLPKVFVYIPAIVLIEGRSRQALHGK